MKRTTVITTTVGALAVGALLGTGLTGLASAGPSASSSAGASERATMTAERGNGERMSGKRGNKHGKGWRAERGSMLHGEQVVKTADGTIVTYRNVHGTVTAVSDSSISVRAEDGFSATFTINADTVFGSKRQTGSRTDVQVGSEVGVMGRVDGSTAIAQRVHVRPTSTV
jgi:hypothetical protein